MLPGPAALALLVVPLVWAAVVVTARPLGAWTLAGALGGAQLVLHEALMALSGPTCALPTSVTGMHMPHMGAVPVSSAVAGCAAHTTMAGAAPGAGPAMVLAHGVATVLTALLLAHGERALAGTLALLRSAKLRLTVVAAPTPYALIQVARTLHTYDPARPASAVLAGGAGRRGPPVVRRAALPA
jgi:hypothetical protein